jgi:Mn-dependent DtxR family transcriptional regulator
MARQADRERTQQIAGYVEQHPGVRPAEIAKALDVPRSSVTRTLPALEDDGRLLFEQMIFIDELQFVTYTVRADGTVLASGGDDDPDT